MDSIYWLVEEKANRFSVLLGIFIQEQSAGEDKDTKGQDVPEKLSELPFTRVSTLLMFVKTP